MEYRNENIGMQLKMTWGLRKRRRIPRSENKKNRHKYEGTKM